MFWIVLCPAIVRPFVISCYCDYWKQMDLQCIPTVCEMFSEKMRLLKLLEFAALAYLWCNIILWIRVFHSATFPVVKGGGWSGFGFVILLIHELASSSRWSIELFFWLIYCHFYCLVYEKKFGDFLIPFHISLFWLGWWQDPNLGKQLHISQFSPISSSFISWFQK